jgi:hypothetical protein
MTPETRNRIKAALLADNRRKYPNTPDHCRPQLAFSDASANALTQATIHFLRAEGHQAERISTTGRQIDGKKRVRDILGHDYTIGGTQWIPGTGTPGSADISATIGGQSVKIEIKYGKDRQSEAQKAYQRNVEDAGGVYWLIRTLDELLTKYDQLMEEITTREIDKMIFAMAKLKSGTYPVNERQLKLIKEGWQALHDFDSNYEYTLVEESTKIRKEGR